MKSQKHAQILSLESDTYFISKIENEVLEREGQRTFTRDTAGGARTVPSLSSGPEVVDNRLFRVSLWLRGYFFLQSHLIICCIY